MDVYVNGHESMSIWCMVSPSCKRMIWILSSSSKHLIRTLELMECLQQVYDELHLNPENQYNNDIGKNVFVGIMCT